jgi:hypothetical protein
LSPVQDHVQRTVAYLEQDLVLYESVANNGELKGKLGVGMITNATAALNLFGWLLYQTLDQKINDRDLFKKLITDDRFFTVTDFINEKVLYGIVRCGVVHQFYPKNISIFSAPRKDDSLCTRQRRTGRSQRDSVLPKDARRPQEGPRPYSWTIPWKRA